MPDARPLLYRARWPLLALAILVELAFVGYWLLLGVQEIVLLVYGSVLMLIQGVFIGTTLSLRRWPRAMVAQRRPIRSVIVAGALVASAVSVGFLYTILEWPGWWWKLDHLIGHPITFFTPLVVGWIVWSVVFYFYWRRHDRYTALTRITRSLLAGSVLETLIAAPTMAFVKDPDNCVCARGSFFGLVFGISAILCIFGPGVLMIFLRQRYIAARLIPMCVACGYNLTGSVSASCPECGEAIPQRVREEIDNHQGHQEHQVLEERL